MAAIPTLFTLPIAPYDSPTAPSPGGTFTLHQLKPNIYLLTFNSPPDNRLTPPFLQTFLLALDILASSPSLYPPGILITTSSIPKFYSNGLDFTAATSDPEFMTRDLYPLWRRLLTYPMPTVAVLNGHTFAGGLMTAMAHDYRIMNPNKGFLCLNELEFNAVLLPPMASIFKAKLPCNATFRNMALEARRFSAQAALEAGIVDGLGAVEDAVTLFQGSGLIKKITEARTRPGGENGGSYGKIKEEMYREVIADLDLSMAENTKRLEERDKRRQEIEAGASRKMQEWKVRSGVKAKL